MDKFRVGQKVRIIKVHRATEWLGTITTIIQPKRRLPFHEGYIDAYTVDIAPPVGYLTFSVPEDCLEPVYDGDQKSSWSESAWKPKDVSVPRKDAQPNEQERV